MATIQKMRSGPTVKFLRYLLSCLQLCALLMLRTWAGAEEIGLESITKADGLASSSISAIVQDRWGYLWFGTQGGLQKYDGYTFQTFGFEPYRNNCLSHNLVQTLYLEKEKDVLWIGTYGGLNRLDILTETFTVYRSVKDEAGSLSSDIVVSIRKDSYGDLWVGTLDGLNVMKNGTDSFRRYSHRPGDPSSLAGNVVRAIHEDSQGDLWIGTVTGFQKYDRQTDSFISFRPETVPAETFPGPGVMSIIEDAEGILWIGTWGGSVSAFDPRSGSFRVLPLPGINIYSLFLERRGTLFAATWGQGLIEIDRKTLSVIDRRTFTGKPTGISNNIVYSLLEDTSGILWIGTNGGGVNKYDRNRYYYPLHRNDIENPESITRGKITSVLEDSDGTLWAGIYSGGLDRLNRQRGTWDHFRSVPGKAGTLVDNAVNCLLEDSRGRFLVGTGKGIDLLDRKTGKFSRFLPGLGKENPTGDDIIYALEEDAEGNLWIGTYHSGVTVYNPATNTFRYYPADPGTPSALSDNLVYTIFRDRRNRMWIGTNRGLNRYDPATDSFIRYTYDSDDPESLSGNTVRELYETADGSLWVGTVGGGLSKYHPETDSFTHFLKSDGLPENSVIAILDDVRGTLWVGTPNGIAVFDPQTKTFIRLDGDNGIRVQECTVGHDKSRTGTLYFGSLEGLQEVNNHEYRQLDFSPAVVITSFSVFGEEKNTGMPMFTTQNLRLSWSERHFTFSFAALDYRTPRKNRFAYMLEGFERDWHYTGTRNFGSYTNIPPGKYTLRVRGSNTSGVWSGNEAKMIVTVLPPPWKTVWAYLLFAAAGVAVFFVVIELMTGAKLKQKIHELNATKEDLREANRKLQLLSTTDDLTGIPNKRYFMNILVKEWRQCIREHEPLSVLMLDLDFFKRYNDNYGHLAGDACLKAAAVAITKVLYRPRDVVARFGGEEFVILLPDTNEAGAYHVAEKIRVSIQNLCIPHGFSDAAPFLTASIGISTTIPAPERSPEQPVEEADHALYLAKSRGKNMVASQVS